MSQTPILEKTASKSKPRLIDRQAVLRALAEHNKAIGFEPSATMTIAELRQQMIAEGIDPEKNEASREMIAMRYPGEEVE